MSTVVKKEPSKELRDVLMDYADIWAREWNWKLYTKELFSLNTQFYYKYHQYPSSNSVELQSFIKVRNDFIYWEMKEIGNSISNLQNKFSDYSIHDSWNNERFLKRIKAQKGFKASFKEFKMKIINDPDSFERSNYLKSKIESFNSDELIYCVSIIYQDFCKIYEFLVQKFDSKIPVNPLAKVNRWGGTLPQAVLYHMVLAKAGIEKELDTSSEEEATKLSIKYGYKGSKRWIDHHKAIVDNKEIVRGRKPIFHKDGEIVENALKENYPEKTDLIDELYKITFPIYP